MKLCHICNKKLSFRDSFVWKDQPICNACLQEKTNSSNSVKIKEKKSLLDLPSWGLSLISAFSSFIFTLFLASLLRSILNDENLGDGIALSTYAIFIALACFLICRKNPKSIWYVPILGNICGIFAAVVEPNFWISPLWIVIFGGWILSLIGSISGAIVGNRSFMN